MWPMKKKKAKGVVFVSHLKRGRGYALCVGHKKTGNAYPIERFNVKAIAIKSAKRLAKDEGYTFKQREVKK